MTFVLITNSISPHQMPLAQCLVSLLGCDNFRYVTTEELSIDRKKLGWDHEILPKWVLQSIVYPEQGEIASAWMNDADIVLCGNRDIGLFENRSRSGKITLYMSERWFKPPAGMLRLFYPSYFRLCVKTVKLLQSPHFFYLPMGVYAAKDMHRLNTFLKGISKLSSLNGKLLLWGYFVGLSVSIPPQYSGTNDKIQILWFGRFLKLKKVNLLIEAIHQMDEFYRKKINVRIIGMGPQESSLKALVKKYALLDIIDFSVPKPINEIRLEIRKADICVVTSNAQEGWGVSVNEIMAEQSCVIASDAAGASATLIQHGQNGLLFKSGSVKDLLAQLNLVCNDMGLRTKLSQAAYQTIRNEWSPEVAADRLVKLSLSLLEDRLNACYDSGPLKLI